MNKITTKIKYNDLTFGLKMEYRLYQFLKKENPAVEWLSLTDKFSMFDYRLGDVYIELKARRYIKKRFDKNGGHMIETSKFQFLKKNNIKKAIIFYMYQDGLYKFTYRTHSNKKTYTIADGGRADRKASTELKKVAYIDGKYLKLVSQNIYTPVEKDICIL